MDETNFGAFFYASQCIAVSSETDPLIKPLWSSQRSNTAPQSLFVALVVWPPDRVTVSVPYYAAFNALVDDPHTWHDRGRMCVRCREGITVSHDWSNKHCVRFSL